LALRTHGRACLMFGLALAAAVGAAACGGAVSDDEPPNVAAADADADRLDGGTQDIADGGDEIDEGRACDLPSCLVALVASCRPWGSCTVTDGAVPSCSFANGIRMDVIPADPVITPGIHREEGLRVTRADALCYERRHTSGGREIHRWVTPGGEVGIIGFETYEKEPGRTAYGECSLADGGYGAEAVLPAAACTNSVIDAALLFSCESLCGPSPDR